MIRLPEASSRIAAALCALLVAGCGTLSWNPVNWFRGQPAHKPTPLTEIRATVTPRAQWTVPVGKSGGFRFHPEVAGGRVYAAAADGTVTVVEEDSGRVLARHDTKKKLASGVEVAEGRIIVGSAKGEVLALETEGRPAWTTSVAGEVIAPAAVTRKTVVVRTADGRVFGLSMEDGKRRWVYQRPTPALLLRSDAGVLAIERDVVAGFPNGKLLALDVEDGKLTWEVTVSQPQGATELERIADIGGLPVVEGGRVCAAAFQGKVGCFEIQTRNLVWSRDLSTARTLALDPRNVYLVDATGAVHALDKGSGASVWKQDKLLYRRLSAPIAVDGKVVVGDGFGFLHVLSPDDGSLIGRLATDGTPIHMMVPSGAGFVAQTEGGALVSVRF